MTISFQASAVRSRSIAALIGMLADSSPTNESASFINSDPQAVDVWTITVDTATNSFAYTIVVAGATIVYTADASATVAEIADGLADAINDDPIACGHCGAVSDGVSVIVITALLPDDLLAITEGSATAAKLTTVHTTTADEADPIPFGRLVCGTGSFDEESGVEQVALAKSSSLTAQVDTLTVDYAAGEQYTVMLTIEGRTYIAGPVLATVDDATTATAIRAAINAIMPANSVIASGATDQVILTAEVVGKAFVTAIGLLSGTTARLALVSTTSGILTDVNQAARGISAYSADEEITTIAGEEASYPGNDGLIAITRGPVWVECAEVVTPGLPVYVELGVTADNGQFFVATSATRVRLTRATWVRDSNSDGDSIAVLRFA